MIPLEHLQALVDTSRDAIIAADQDGRITFCNAATERMFGYVARELVGQPVTLLMPERVRQAWANVANVGKIVEAAGRRKDGSEVSIELSCERHGESLLVVHVRDLTPREQRDAAARKTETFYQRMIETTREGVLILDARGRVSFANARLENLLGHAPGALVGKHVFDLMDEEGRALAARNLERRREGVAEGGDFRFKHVDGADVWFQFESTPIEEEGTYAGLFSMLTDITERHRAEAALKQSETQLRHTHEIARIGTWSWDVERDIITRSDQLCRLLGVDDSYKIVDAATFFGQIHRDDRARAKQAIERVIREGGALEIDYRLELPDGIRFLHVRAELTTDGRGRILHGTVQDQTERRQLEARMVLADRMSSVGTLAAGVAHEINNPLACVTTNLDMIAEEIRAFAGGSPSARMREMEELANDARAGAERMRKIVRGLKTFSRTDTDQRIVLDVRHVLDLAINLAFNELRHRARLVKDYSEVPRVLADEGRLAQVFVNLIVNAAQAIPEGHAERNEIRIVTSTDRDGRAVVEIRDTGQGIPADMVARIFDPFFTTKPIGVGTGLGLSICHSLVTALGGEISAESLVGRGTGMRVVLPPAQDAAMASATTSREAPSTVGPRGAVLIVDDDTALAASIRRLLRDHDVAVAASGTQALDLFREGKRFDVILCDLMMPEMTGMELFRQIQLDIPDQAERFVFVTGGAFTPDGREFLDTVLNECVEKPFAPQSLRAMVQRFVK